MQQRVVAGASKIKRNIPLLEGKCFYACTALPRVRYMPQWIVYHIVCRPDGGGGTVWWLGHGTEVWGICFNSRERWKITVFSKPSGMVLGHPQSPVQWVALFRAVKRQGRKRLHFTPSSSEVINELSCTAKLLCLHGLHRDNFRDTCLWTNRILSATL